MAVKNIVAINWEYKNKSWETKKNYVTIGKYFIKDDWKESIKLENIPVWRNGRASIYEIEKKDWGIKRIVDEKSNPIIDDDMPF